MEMAPPPGVYEEKPMGAVSAFTTGNCHCEPLMTDVTVISSSKYVK